jgi:hypothetical protein
MWVSDDKSRHLVVLEIASSASIPRVRPSRISSAPIDPQPRPGSAIDGDISDRNVVVALVAHLGLPTAAPPMARARSPAFELA